MRLLPWVFDPEAVPITRSHHLSDTDVLPVCFTPPAFSSAAIHQSAHAWSVSAAARSTRFSLLATSTGPRACTYFKVDEQRRQTTASPD